MNALDAAEPQFKSLRVFLGTIEERLNNNWTNGADTRYLVEQIRLKDAALKQIHQAYGALTAGLIAKRALDLPLSRTEAIALREYEAKLADRGIGY